LGIALFVPGFFTGLGIPVFNFISKLSYPLSLAGPIIIAWYAIGIVLAIYFSVRHPDRIRDTAKAFIQTDAPELSKAPPTSVPGGPPTRVPGRSSRGRRGEHVARAV